MSKKQVRLILDVGHLESSRVIEVPANVDSLFWILKHSLIDVPWCFDRRLFDTTHTSYFPDRSSDAQEP